jgi:molybdate transport system ATP-binding protein
LLVLCFALLLTVFIANRRERRAGGAMSLALHCRATLGEFSLDAELQLASRGITAVYGRSGAGKTTLLRCIAGLEPAAMGRVVFNDTVWQDQAKFVHSASPPHRPRIPGRAAVPHLTVLGNLEIRRPPGAPQWQRTVDRAHRRTAGIARSAVRDVDGLSGQRQRVAIARATDQSAVAAAR